MIGKIAGQWTIVGNAGKNIRRVNLWICKCKCGYECKFTMSYINTMTQTSMCKRCRTKFKHGESSKKYINKTIGDWTVIKYLGLNKYGSMKWLCRCKCGKERKFGTSMISGHKKSASSRMATLCRDCHSEKLEIANRIYEIPYRFWKRFLDHSGKRRNKSIPILITKEEAQEIYDKQNGECALTGVKLYFTKFSTNFNRYTNASMDRIDSTKPYSKENIQWVHKKINIMKHTSSNKDFIILCRYVVDYADGNRTKESFPGVSLFSP